MATAIIKSTISSTTIVGSRDDASIGGSVQLEHDGSASTYFWQFLSRPPGSTSTFSSSSAAAPTFTPDIAGSYLIRLTIDGDSAGADVRVIAVKTANLSMRIPAAGETNEYNNNPITGIDGWHEATYNAFNAIDSIAGKIIKSDGTGATPSAAISWGGQRLTNLGAPSLSSDAVRLQDVPAAISDLTNTSTLAQLNTLISDATLDDSSDTRTPSVHAIGGAQHSASTLADLNALVSDATLDDSSDTRTPSLHALGGAQHSASTLAELNALVSDATLDDTGSPRTPLSHSLGGVSHSADTLSNLNSKITDATLVDEADIDLDFAYDRGNIIYTDNGPVIVRNLTSLELHDGYIRLEEASDPTATDSYGSIYVKDVDGYTELFYIDNYGTVTQITDDGYLDTFNSLRGIGLYAQTSDPTPVDGKAFIYTKEVDGYVELIYLDNNSNSISLTNSGKAGGTLQTSYNNSDEPKIVLNSTRGAFSIEDAETPLGTELFEVSSFGNAVEYFSVNAERTNVDGYITLREQNSDPAGILEAGHIYTKEADGYTELFYMDDYGTTIRLTEKKYVAAFTMGATVLEDSIITSDFTAIAGFHYRVNPTGGKIDISLPPVSANYGKVIIIKNQSDSNNSIELLPDGSDTIDGEISIIFSAARTSIVLRSDGASDWMVV